MEEKSETKEKLGEKGNEVLGGGDETSRPRWKRRCRTDVEEKNAHKAVDYRQ